MKIKKLYESAQPLTEADELEINPEVDSVDDIADAAKAQVEVGTEGDETLSDANADKLAGEIKATGDEIGAESAVVFADLEVLGTDNAITRVLEKALARAKRNKRRGIKSGNNVLITGLPGSGKTASVYDWAKSKGSDVNLVYVNAKNNDLEAYINGYTVRDLDKPMSVGQAYSSNLSDLEKPNSVLFLDEYNRQVKPHIRASLYTLINEHKIAGEGDNKTHEFKNLLFTVACINPSIPTDKGAAPLNDAELSRFLYHLRADSDKESAKDYITKHFDKAIAGLDPNDEFYLEDLEAYLRIQDLGIFILEHEGFDFDTAEDLEDLASEQKKMHNQRAFAEVLVASEGDVDEFGNLIKDTANFLDKVTQKYMEILSDYRTPTLEELLNAKGITVDDTLLVTDEEPEDAAPEAEETPVAETDDEAELELEDDDDFFTGAGQTAGAVLTPTEVSDIINKALANW